MSLSPVITLLPQNRSPCPLMPGTPPGCRLMAGRDRRSNMETGKVHYQLLRHYTDFFFLNLGLIGFLLFSQQYQDHYVLLPSALHLLPWPGVRLVWKPGSVFALERAQEAGAAGGHLGLVRHRKLNQRMLLLAYIEVTQSTWEWMKSPCKHFQDRNTALWKQEHVCLQPD